MMRKIKSIFDKIEDIINSILLIFSKGFFFYFYSIFYILSKLIPLSFLKKIKEFFKKRQNDTVTFLFIILLFLVGANLYVRFYIENTPVTVGGSNATKKIDKLDEKELNLYRRYSKLSLDSVSFKDLLKTNKEVIVWIAVDGTNINYPVVKANDNDYYLNHDINKDLKASGWIFMDYRNARDLSDDNTIFYGHNLANKTAFGSLSNLFTKDWFKKSNHRIVVLTEDGKYEYEVFSVYRVSPEVYYLQNNFNSKDDALLFMKALKSRSKFNFKVDLEKDDRIITLSTCSDDNKSRDVVHAKLIKE